MAHVSGHIVMTMTKMMNSLTSETRVMFIMTFFHRHESQWGKRSPNLESIISTGSMTGMMQNETAGALLGCLNVVSSPLFSFPHFQQWTNFGFPRDVDDRPPFQTSPKNPPHVKPRIPYSHLYTSRRIAFCRNVLSVHDTRVNCMHDEIVHP